MHVIDYRINGDDMQFVEIELDPNEAVVAEAGGMMFMDDDIAMETIFGDGSQQNQGFLGALLGAGLGLLVIHFRGALQGVFRQFGFDPFPKSFHGFEVLPAHVNPAEIVIIAVCAFILCALAAFVPAFFAARSDAAKSLRNL